MRVEDGLGVGIGGDDHDDRDRVQAHDRLLQPPERQERKRVRLGGDVDQTVVGKGSRERRRDHRSTGGKPGGPRQAALDPGEQRDEEERRDVEEIPFLHAGRQCRCERADLEQQPEEQRQRRCEEHAQRSIEGPPHQSQE